MSYKICERLDEILKKDKINYPQELCDILKEEIKPIILNYIDLDDDIRVRYKEENGKNIFWIELSANRIKTFGYIAK